MSNDTKTSKRPTHYAYSVRDYQQNKEWKADWTRVGVAWAHSDGEGFDVLLEALPINGRVVVRKPKPKADQQA